MNQATVRVRQKWGTVLRASTTGKVYRDRIHKGEETIRTGYCDLHSRKTSQFIGVNEHGWIFGCPGGLRIEGEAEEHQPIGHYFVNLPAS